MLQTEVLNHYPYTEGRNISIDDTVCLKTVVSIVSPKFSPPFFKTPCTNKMEG